MGEGEEKAEFRISLTSRAYRDLAKLLKTDASLAERISEKIDLLSRQPTLGKRLRGRLRNKRSLRVGNYRIIYEIDIASKEILVTNMGHRRDVYDH